MYNDKTAKYQATGLITATLSILVIVLNVQRHPNFKQSADLRHLTESRFERMKSVSNIGTYHTNPQCLPNLKTCE